MIKIYVSNFIVRQVIQWFFALPGHQDIGLWKLSEADWIILEDLEMVLKVRFTRPTGFFSTNLSQVPHCAQQTMSGEHTPLLGNVVPTFEMFIAQWQALGEQLPRCAPYIDAGLNCARKYYERMGKTCAYTIAMRKSN